MGGSALGRDCSSYIVPSLATRSVQSIGASVVSVDEDHGDSLNVALVREGRYAANSMIDMVEADQQIIASLPLDAKDQFETGLAQAPIDDRSRRLVSDAECLAKRRLVFAAEMDAKTHQRGIWSEAGFPGRAPPQDGYMIRQFFEKRRSFDRIEALASNYPKPASLNRTFNVAQAVQNIGVPQEVAQDYLGLLAELDANEELNRVSGFDDACLIVADILYGAFDNGVIKGYVFRREAPSPIVNDLEDAKAVPGVDTMYRRVDDNWYLFEIWH